MIHADMQSVTDVGGGAGFCLINAFESVNVIDICASSTPFPNKSIPLIQMIKYNSTASSHFTLRVICNFTFSSPEREIKVKTSSHLLFKFHDDDDI